MKELVVISGKGGTGKTSIVSSFASLAYSSVLADCDVDAADLHLILEPSVQEEHQFTGGKEAVIHDGACTRCGSCESLCRFDAIEFDGKSFRIDLLKCEGCGVCARFCPPGAIEMREKIAGNYYISDTRFGTMIHARLGIGEDNSGKLVTRVRDTAKQIAEENGRGLIIIDGSPGIGCPVIASITGAAAVLIVAEPTVSGFHDLKRVVELINHFRIKGYVCVNKWDLNSDMTEQIEAFAGGNGISVIGKIPYDSDVTRAQIEGKSIVEFSSGQASQEIRTMWEKIKDELAHN